MGLGVGTPIEKGATQARISQIGTLFGVGTWLHQAFLRKLLRTMEVASNVPWRMARTKCKVGRVPTIGVLRNFRVGT